MPFDTFDHRKCPKAVIFLIMGIYEIVNTPSNRGAVGAFSCFTNTSLLINKNAVRPASKHIYHSQEVRSMRYHLPN